MKFEMTGTGIVPIDSERLTPIEGIDSSCLLPFAGGMQPDAFRSNSTEIDQRSGIQNADEEKQDDRISHSRKPHNLSLFGLVQQGQALQVSRSRTVSAESRPGSGAIRTRYGNSIAV